MLDFSFREILPHIFHLHFGTGYDLAMHFLRFQEYYESPKFHHKMFTLVDYMEWYSKKQGKGAFTYAKDWSGFNVPSWILHKVRRADIPDPNKYDKRMFMLIDWASELNPTSKYYFIGSSSEGYQGDGDEAGVLNHEIAHGLYNVNGDYQFKVNNLLALWEDRKPKQDYGDRIKALEAMGYNAATATDELQAYCATGLCKELEGLVSSEEMVPFQKLFQTYKKTGSCARKA